MLSTRFKRKTKLDFIKEFDDLLNATGDVAWTERFFAHSKRLGFDYCLYGTIPHVKSPLSSAWVRSSFPAAWLERYFGRGYIAQDYKLIHCMQGNLPLIWAPEVFARSEQRRIYEEGCGFGLRAGISLPAHGPDGIYGQLCLARDIEPGPEFEKFLEPRLQSILFLRDVLAHSSRSFAYPGCKASHQALTVREQECLRWAALGKSSKQIAELMYCTVSTVNFHIGNAGKKLGANTRQAAIAAAIQSGALVI